MVGSWLEFRRDPTGFLLRVAREYGDIAHFTFPFQEVYLLNHPDYIRDVLVTRPSCFVKGEGLQRAKRVLGDGLLTSEGDLHQRQRRLIQPAFHRDRLNSYGAIMVEHAAAMGRSWRPGETIELLQEMARLTLSIVAKTLLDAEMGGEASEVGEAVTDCLKGLNQPEMAFGGWIGKLPLPSSRRFRAAQRRLDASLDRMLEERRASDEDRGDLLSMLLPGKGEDGHGRMTDAQVRDEIMTLFLAGHETTAVALTWSWYLLALHPEVDTRLRAELDSVLGGRLPTVTDLPRLRYVEMVFLEAMRLYPPVWAITREAVADFAIGGYVLPGGSLVFLSPYVMHRDPRYFPEPLRFDPDRWSEEAQAGRSRFAYFPFGGGPRQCIGERFASMGGVLLLATLAQQWRMWLPPGLPVELQALITLRPRHGMPMRLEQRV